MFGLLGPNIAGNLYYVGANDVTAFLLTGPEGHVLIDGGSPATAPKPYHIGRPTKTM